VRNMIGCGPIIEFRSRINATRRRRWCRDFLALAHLKRNREAVGIDGYILGRQAYVGSIKVSKAWAICGHELWSQKRFVQCDLR
jgi:hypothetical protein